MVISKVLITSVTNSNIKPDQDLSPFSGYFSRWIWVSQYQNVCSLDFIGAKDDKGGGDNWSCKTLKASFKSSPPTNQHWLFTGRMSFLLPNQQRQSTDSSEVLQ